MNIKYIRLQNNDIDFYLCKIPCRDLINITYVSRRGESDEEGSVQRVLNRGRISGISQFLINGGFFPNNIILNFVNYNDVTVNEESVFISDSQRIAQIIDGQHRVAGMREAVKIKPELLDVEFPVVFTLSLPTSKCAELFISINTEQKSVPKSLIYDLYSLQEVPNRDFSIDRGTDIARAMNIDDNSPYQGWIKFPGSSRFKGGIQLSTFTSNLKSLVKPNGEFDKYNLKTLEYQTKILINYFSAISYYYDKKWQGLENPFLYASGFAAAIEVLIDKILPYCYKQRNYTLEMFKGILNISANQLPLMKDVKGLSGESARELLKNKMFNFVNIEVTNEEDINI